MATDPVFESDILIGGSREKADNRYGQNGYLGPSSDEPGDHTTSGFLPKVKLPDDAWQTRKVSTEAYPTTYGMKASTTPIKAQAKISHTR